ncbi:MAG: glycosyltransferase, partial [Desulfatitalea sp.]|nr:glycosyltransferase [Desulfatitalea sp.]
MRTPTPLRIAMLTLHSSPVGPLGTRKTGGMSVYVRELSRHLGAAGHCIDIFTCAGDTPGQHPLYPNVRLLRLAGDLHPLPDEAGLSSAMERIAGQVDDQRRALDLHYDLIHSHYWISGGVGATLQRRWQVPHVTMFHTLGAVKNSTPCAENASSERIAQERRLAATADVVITAADREADYLVTFYDARRESIRTIACGVDLD